MKKPKKPKKRRLKIRLTRAWLVEVVDEDECEVDSDWCFGTREDAMRDGERMLKNLKADGRYSDPVQLEDYD